MQNLDYKRILVALLLAFASVIIVILTDPSAAEDGTGSISPQQAASALKENIKTNEETEEAERLTLISTFWKCINSGDWLSWAELYTPIEREDRFALVTNEQNRLQHIGILTITEAAVEEIVSVDDSYAPWIYSELQPYYENPDNYACYRVRVNINVAVENGYYSNGTCYQLFVLVKDEGSWGIGAMCPCPDELLPGYDAQHDNPYYTLKNRDYSDAYMILPVDYIEYYGSNLNGVQDPFEMSFVLPRGWSYRVFENGMDCQYLDEWVQSGDHSIVLIYNSLNICVGALGYARASGTYTNLSTLFVSLENDRVSCLEEDSYITVSKQLENPSTNITAISCAARIGYDMDGNAVSSINPLIISYSADQGVFVAFEFNAKALTSLQLMDIAEGIRLY